MQYAEAMIRGGLAFEGVHEVGFNNAGWQVEEFQEADDLAGGRYAWCVDLWQFVDVLLGRRLPSRTASVGFLEDAFENAGWMQAKPSRGCLAFWRLDAGSWPDHIFGVTSVVSLGRSLVLRTIEGNTSPGSGGSQDDGGGVYRRTRVIPAGAVTFGKVPGQIDDVKVRHALDAVRGVRARSGVVTLSRAEKLAAWVPTTKPPDDALFWLWLRWKLGEGDYKRYGKANMAKRPKALPSPAPQAWHRRAEKFVGAR